MSNGLQEAKPILPTDMDVFTFCRNPGFGYISLTLGLGDFKKARNSVLRFHAAPLPPEALQNEIEHFADQLGAYLVSLAYHETSTARAETRAAVTKPDDPVQGLLDAVAKNYVR